MTLSEIPFRTVYITVSGEEFRELDAAAKKRGLSIEDYLEMIVDEYRKLNGDLPGEKKKRSRRDFFSHGDKLMIQLCELEGEYIGVSRRDEGYYFCSASGDEEALLDKIHSDLKFVHSRVRQFSAPDLTREKWIDSDMNRAAEWQRECEKCFPGKTWDELRAPVLRSYKRLEKDLLAFREEVENTPDEVFNVIFK